MYLSIFINNKQGSKLFAACERYIVTQFAELRDKLEDMTRAQGEIVKRLNSMTKAATQATVPELPDDIQFPLRSVEEVDVLEGKLVDLTLQDQLVSSDFDLYIPEV